MYFLQFYATYKDPEGKSVFPATVVQTESEHEKIAVLEKRVRELQQQLSQEVCAGHVTTSHHDQCWSCDHITP